MRWQLLLVAACAPFLSVAQSEEPIPEKGYYVILGAFAVKDNAVNFRKTVDEMGVKSSYGFLPSRGLYYVFVDGSKSLPSCLDQVKTVRMKKEYADAWVRFIEDERELAARKTNPVEQPKPTVAAEIVANPEPAKKDSVVVAIEEPQPEPEVEEPATKIFVPITSQMTLENMDTFLSLYNEANDRVVDGKVQVVDTDRGRLITEVKGNSYLKLPDPKSQSGRLSLICEAFGYRKIQQEILFRQPLTDSTRSFVEEMGSSLIIKFGLARYNKGDINVLYNVYFYNDAAIFLPESKFELNELLVMMKEDDKLRIRLHGHSNGNYHGKIIKVGPSGNFFSVAEDSNTTIGSAKELSEARAEVIKSFLVANGIDESRMEIKAWGGKKPIYDKKGANAKKNIRVEVEVL